MVYGAQICIESLHRGHIEVEQWARGYSYSEPQKVGTL